VVFGSLFSSYRILTKSFGSFFFSFVFNSYSALCILIYRFRDLEFDKFWFVVSLFCKSSIFLFSSLTDMWAVDLSIFPKVFNFSARFQLNYLFFSMYNITFRFLFSFMASLSDYVPTLTKLFFSAAWLEREIWDLFGLVFWGNSDLRRILTDCGFIGHPMQKSFPVVGFKEVRYDDSLGVLVFEPVLLTQEFRNFFVGNPWLFFLCMYIRYDVIWWFCLII